MTTRSEPKKLDTQTLHVEDVPASLMRRLRVWAVQHGLTINPPQRYALTNERPSGPSSNGCGRRTKRRVFTPSVCPMRSAISCVAVHYERLNQRRGPGTALDALACS
jgi:hypothetical protein